MFALTQIKGVGRRYACIVCRKADVDLNKRFVVYKTLFTAILKLTIHQCRSIEL